MPRRALMIIALLAIALTGLTLLPQEAAGQEVGRISVTYDQILGDMGAITYVDASQAGIAVYLADQGQLALVTTGGSVEWSIPEENLMGIAWSPNASLIAVGSPPYVKFYSLTGTLVSSIELPGENYLEVEVLEWSSDGVVWVRASRALSAYYSLLGVKAGGEILYNLSLPNNFYLEHYKPAGDGLLLVSGILDQGGWHYIIALYNATSGEEVYSIETPAPAVLSGGAYWVLAENGTLYKFDETAQALEQVATLDAMPEGFNINGYAVDAPHDRLAVFYSTASPTEFEGEAELWVYTLEGSTVSTASLGVMPSFPAIEWGPLGTVILADSGPTSRFVVVDSETGQVAADISLPGYLYFGSTIRLSPSLYLIVHGWSHGLLRVWITALATLKLEGSGVAVNVTIAGPNGTMTLTLGFNESKTLHLPPGNYTVTLKPILTDTSSYTLVPGTLDYLAGIYTYNLTLTPENTTKLQAPGPEEVVSNLALVTITGQPGSNVTVTAPNGETLTLTLGSKGEATLLGPPGNYTIKPPGAPPNSTVSVTVNAGEAVNVNTIPSGAPGETTTPPPSSGGNASPPQGPIGGGAETTPAQGGGTTPGSPTFSPGQTSTSSPASPGQGAGATSPGQTRAATGGSTTEGGGLSASAVVAIVAVVVVVAGALALLLRR